MHTHFLKLLSISFYYITQEKKKWMLTNTDVCKGCNYLNEISMWNENI